MTQKVELRRMSKILQLMLMGLSLKQIRQSAKFWWQRRTRGWDDSDLWDLDITIATFVLPRLKRFVETSKDTPFNLSDEEWHEDLQTIIKTFEAISTNYKTYRPTDSEHIQKGLDLFAKHFTSLWD